MKKIALLLVLSLLICAVFCGCGGGKDLASNIEGTWTMTSISDGESTEVSLEEFSESLGFDMSDLELSFTFDKDGAVHLSAGGESEEGTYEVNGDKVAVTLTGITADLTYDADKEALYFEEEISGMTVYMTKK